MSKRAVDFKAFAATVERHIDNYTVPQYGDEPYDQVETWTSIQCMDSIKRYINRFGTNRRGRIETLRDLVKIAHYAQLTFDKMQPTLEEFMSIEGGER
jgi:hypothetical protein